jgi:hypothetical protein
LTRVFVLKSLHAAVDPHPWRDKQLTSIGNSVTIARRTVSVGKRRNYLIFNRSSLFADSGTVEAYWGEDKHAPSKRGPKRKYVMKKSILVKTVAALFAIGAAFPLGAFAAPPAKSTAEHGASKPAHVPRKHYFAKGWLES